ncbi:hypothetical protein [Streptomyces sp. NRRL S-337]|uniref:hypothetical protein n=1 Tax=Streptomyces sp. NRRL S-337 TaxID=1463900 RepID=UPI002D218426|nr:hypothetical protein [Streptomyces sp. NRRL S-337]
MSAAFRRSPAAQAARLRRTSGPRTHDSRTHSPRTHGSRTHGLRILGLRIPRPRTRGLRARLPWWALALPVVSFMALLAVVASPARASAASAPQGFAVLLQYLAGILRIGA